MLSSFPAQGSHRIHPTGAARRQLARDRRDTHQTQRNQPIERRIELSRASFTPAEAVRNYDRVAALAQGLGGGVWAGRLLGSVTRFKGSGPAGRPVAEGLPPMTEIHEDPDGTLWVGTWRGLFRLGAGRRDSLTTRDGLPDDFIRRKLRFLKYVDFGLCRN